MTSFMVNLNHCPKLRTDTGGTYGLIVLPKNRFERDAAKSALILKRSVIPVIEWNLRQSVIRVIRVSRSANRYPANIILRSAIRLALTTEPTGSGSRCCHRAVLPIPRGID